VEVKLEQILNLLLESERAGVVVCDALAAQVTHEDLRKLLLTGKEDEGTTAAQLERLIGENGGIPSAKVGPFAAKIAALSTLRERLELLIKGEQWVARKVEEALALAPPSGPVHDYLQKMANRHRFAAEWTRAEIIRMLDEIG
jgi:nitronate monooxygenase